MSWKSGSELMNVIITNVKDKMDSEDKESFYKEMISYFEDSDCDTLYECLKEDPVFDKVFAEVSFFAIDEDESIEEWDGQDNTSF